MNNSSLKKHKAELHNKKYVENQAYAEDRIRDPKKYSKRKLNSYRSIILRGTSASLSDIKLIS